MHHSAKVTAGLFFSTYLRDGTGLTAVEIGAQDVNGSLREVASPGLKYVGVDFVAGKGVDVVLDDPYHLPFDDASVDVCLSSSVFEHSEMFWLLFLEILRILKPGGLVYLNAPSNGIFHRYPVDCWRFYPDSGKALVTWARHSGYRTQLLESFVGDQDGDYWNDFVAVYVKDEAHAAQYPARMVDRKRDYLNGFVAGREGILNASEAPQDRKLLDDLRARLDLTPMRRLRRWWKQLRTPPARPQGS